MTLRGLDDRHLPAAASRLRAWLDRAEARWDHVRDVLEAWEPGTLDTRYAGRVPFSLLLRKPVAGLVVTALLLVAAVGVVIVRESEGTDARGPGATTELMPQGDAPRGSLLGPQPGDHTRDYVQQAGLGLVEAVHTTPNGQRVALISFADYRTPEQARALLSGFTVRRAFLRAKAAGAQAMALPVDVRGDLLTVLRTAYAETVRNRAAAQKQFQGYAHVLPSTSAKDRKTRDVYVAYARSSGIEAREYAHDCACVYSVLVTSTPILLLSLNARPGVRAVEVAAAGLGLLQVQVQPLLPEVDGVVPRPRVEGQS